MGEGIKDYHGQENRITRKEIRTTQVAVAQTMKFSTELKTVNMGLGNGQEWLRLCSVPAGDPDSVPSIHAS